MQIGLPSLSMKATGGHSHKAVQWLKKSFNVLICVNSATAHGITKANTQNH